jgi:hypothetical protein
MKKTSIAITSLVLLLALGCKNQSTESYSAAKSSEATASQATNLSPEDLGKLGAEIKNRPHDAQKILSEKGLTEQQFEQAIRKVADDPAASKRYAEAYKKARA